MNKRTKHRSGRTGTKTISSKTTKRVVDRKGQAYDVPVNPDGTIPIEYLEQRSINGHKNLSGWVKDLGRSNRTTYPINAPPEQMLPWIKDPAKYDVEGIDALPGAEVKKVRVPKEKKAPVKTASKPKKQSVTNKKTPVAKKDPSAKKSAPVKKDNDVPKEVADEVIKGIQEKAAQIDFRKELDKAEQDYLKERSQKYPTQDDISLMSLMVRILQDTDSYSGTSLDVMSKYLTESGWSPESIEKALEYLMDTGHMYEVTLGHFKLIDVPPYVKPVAVNSGYHAFISGLSVEPRKHESRPKAATKKKEQPTLEFGMIKGSRIKDLAQIFPCDEVPINTDDKGMVSADHTTYVYCNLFDQPGRSLFNLSVDNGCPLFVDIEKLAKQVSAASIYKCTVDGKDLVLSDTATGKEIRMILSTSSPYAQKMSLIDSVKKKAKLDNSFDVDGERLLTGVKRAAVIEDDYVSVRVKNGNADLLSAGTTDDLEHIDMFGKQKIAIVPDSERDVCSGIPIKTLKAAISPISKGSVNIELGMDEPILIHGDCHDLTVHTVISPRDDTVDGVSFGERQLAYDKKRKGPLSKWRRKS